MTASATETGVLHCTSQLLAVAPLWLAKFSTWPPRSLTTRYQGGASCCSVFLQTLVLQTIEAKLSPRNSSSYRRDDNVSTNTQPNGLFEIHQDDHGLTPLALALITGSHEAAARLASLGADVSAADTQGVAPAHRAAGHGDLSALELLKGSGADFETQSGAGTPLHWAAGEVRNEVYLSTTKNWWMEEIV